MDILEKLRSPLADRYTVEREIGAGGMATVYLARDIRHRRPVALKVLNPELGAVLGAERFLSEINVTANLQHPHLLPLFDSGEADGLLFYVMPYVEGESLRVRLDRERQMPVDDAIRIAVAVAGALDYAHSNGVVHRDLKPENILLQAGQPLIADFGIALAVTKAGGARITQTGLSLGTPQYMSPEQATGDRAIDGRADIYSLGAVLYEMLTGEPPHSGNTVQAIIARIVTEKPRPVGLLRDTVPEHVEIAIETALAKVPADRWQTGNAFADALQGKSVMATGSRKTIIARGAARSRGWRTRVADPLVLALATIAVSAAGIAAWATVNRRTATESLPVRFSLFADEDSSVRPTAAQAAISPDGRTIVFTGSDSTGGRRLYVRGIDQLEAHALPGTENPINFCVSPDGKWIVFQSRLSLRKTPLDGGAVSVLAELGPDVTGGATYQLSCAPGEVVIGASAGLVGVPMNGGPPRVAVTTDTTRGEIRMRAPVVIGDGGTVLYTSDQTSVPRTRIGVASLEDGSSTVLDFAAAGAVGYMEGQIIYATPTGALMSVPFDIRGRRLTGKPVRLEEQAYLGNGFLPTAALSRTGNLLYRRDLEVNQPTLFSAGGVSRALAPSGLHRGLRFSPDGSKVALAITSSESTDIWVHEIASGAVTRLTSEGESNGNPEWTPDGKKVLFRSTRSGGEAIWWQPADGSGPAELLLSQDGGVQEAVMSRDGATLVYRTQDKTGRGDIGYMQLAPPRIARVIASTRFNEGAPRLSPDGKWLAYISDETGRYEVYVRPFPELGARWPVSINGGTEPVWMPDGSGLVYRASATSGTGSKYLRARIVRGASFGILGRDSLFQGRFLGGTGHPSYDISPDGKSLLVLQWSGSKNPQFVMVLNWVADLRARLKEQTR